MLNGPAAPLATGADTLEMASPVELVAVLRTPLLPLLWLTLVGFFGPLFSTCSRRIDHPLNLRMISMSDLIVEF